MLIDTPWARVKDITPLPVTLTSAALMALDDLTFAEVLRDHLMPRQAGGPHREAWGKLWSVLGSDLVLANRVFDVLEEFLEQTDLALEEGELDDAQRKRANKFQRLCNEAWNRLEAVIDQPLGWAGRAAAGFNPPARKVIAQLVDAIATHRHTVTSEGPPEAVDEALWAVLSTVHLDPDLYR